MRLKRFAAILLALVMVLSFTACGGQQGEVLAKVKDQNITDADVAAYLNIECLLYGMEPSDFEQQEGYLDYVKNLLLSDLVDMKVMQLYCDEEKIETMPEDWQAQYDDFLAKVKDSEGATEYIEKYKVTDAQLKEYFNNSMARNAFVKNLQEGVTDLEAQAKTYYNEHQDSYAVTEGSTVLDASHILVAEEATAQEVLDKLAAGSGFAELAAEYGTDGTKTSGGALGLYEVGSNGWDADFEAAAVKLAAGETSGIVKSQFGYHIIHMNNKLNAGDIKPFESVQKDIENTILGEAYTTKLTELREKYGAEIIEKKDDAKKEDDKKDDGADQDASKDGADQDAPTDGADDASGDDKTAQ